MSTALAPTKKAATLKDLILGDGFKEAVRQAVPKHLTPDMMLRVVVTQLTKNPKLAQCTQESFCSCVLTCSQVGLPPDGRRAHLIPFENKKKGITECTVIFDYKGLSELVYNAGVVSYLHSDVVREGDLFSYSKGVLKEHVPWFLRRDAERPEEAGAVYAVYSLANMKDGGEKCEVLAASEVISIRDNSQGWRAFKAGYAQQSPWDPKNPVSEQEMFKKTAFRRLSKWLPLSSEVRKAFDAEDEFEENRFEAARPIISKPLFALPAVEQQPTIEEPEGQAAPVETEVKNAEPEPPTSESVQDQLADFVTIECTANFDQFKDALVNLQIAKGAEVDTWDSFDAVPAKLATRCLNAKAGLKTQLGLEKERANA